MWPTLLLGDAPPDVGGVLDLVEAGEPFEIHLAFLLLGRVAFQAIPLDERSRDVRELRRVAIRPENPFRANDQSEQDHESPESHGTTFPAQRGGHLDGALGGRSGTCDGSYFDPSDT